MTGPSLDRFVGREGPPRWLAAGDFTYREPPVPVIVGSEGRSLVDAAGRRLLDAEAANGGAILGYDATILDAAIKRVRRLPAVPSFSETALRVDVTRRLCSLVDDVCGTSGRVAVELGGAQGIELAMKIVRATGRTGRIVTFEGGYHGRSPFTAQLSASERYRETSGGGVVPVTRFPHPDCMQCRFGQERATCAHECVAFVERSFSTDLVGVVGATEDVAAVVIEPVLNVGAMAMPDREYLLALIDACRARGALVVVDEVFTGLYRLGTRWGFEQHDLAPDLVVFSKALTNGITPLSCVWGREEVIGPGRWTPGTHSSTFAGNPFALAVVDAVLDRLADDGWRGGAIESVQVGLQTVVDQLAATFPALVASTWVMGAVARILLTGPHAATLRSLALTIADDAPDDGFHGLLVASTGMARNVVALHPPFTTSGDELAVVGRLLGRSMRVLESQLTGECPGGRGT